MARRHGSRMDIPRRGQQRHPCAHWRAGSLQDHLVQLSPATRAETLFLHQDQRQPHVERRPSDPYPVCPRLLRGVRHHASCRTEPAQGNRHHDQHR